MTPKNLTMGSLFDGSGGFPLAAAMNGIRPIWSSEVEPYPIKVTSKRFPDMKHYGDISQISGKDIEPVDIITFGSPCQDMSTAGKRKGMVYTCGSCKAEYNITADIDECPQCGESVEKTRSGLFVEAIRIIKEMRNATNGNYPTLIIWENVPGAYTSNKGEDFRTVLEEICSVTDNTASIPQPAGGRWLKAGEIVGDNHSIAWRTLDAQYWGVPQRRRRIFLVADFGGQRAPEILFKSASLQRYFTESEEQGQGAAAAAESGIGKTGEDAELIYSIGRTAWRSSDKFDCKPTVEQGRTPTLTAGEPPAVATCIQGSMIGRADANGPQGSGINEDVCFTLNTIDRHAVAIPYSISSYDCNAMKSPNPHSGIKKAETSRTLDLNGGNPSCNQGGIAVVQCYGEGAFGMFNEGQVSTLKAVGGTLGGGSETLCLTTGGYMDIAKDKAPTLMARDFKSPHTIVKSNDESNHIVRRLTPLECGRLQGFPDWWTENTEIEDPTEEQMRFWREVFETHRKVITGAKKPKTDNQIRKWLREPGTDGAKYKMWGNGIALPCAYAVFKGITAVFGKQNAQKQQK